MPGCRSSQGRGMLQRNLNANAGVFLESELADENGRKFSVRASKFSKRFTAAELSLLSLLVVLLSNLAKSRDRDLASLTTLRRCLFSHGHLDSLRQRAINCHTLRRQLPLPLQSTCSPPPYHTRAHLALDSCSCPFADL